MSEIERGLAKEVFEAMDKEFAEDPKGGLTVYTEDWRTVVKYLRDDARAKSDGGAVRAADRKQFFVALHSFVDDYIDGYELRGDGDYTPNKMERFLIGDCVAGLLSELNQERFLASPQQLAQGPGSQDPDAFPVCDTCGKSMDYMPWHYSNGEKRHLHACDECWVKVNPSASVPEPFGTDSAYTIAKEAGKGNMAISCELVVELVEALRATTPQPASKETAWLNVIEENSWDLRCTSAPTGGDDYDVLWHVIEHHMAEPHEREVGSGMSPLSALEVALNPPAGQEDETYLGTTWRDIDNIDSKPSWNDHVWPQIFNDGEGHWFGVKEGWSLEAHISNQWKGRQVSLLREDGEFLCYGKHPDWEESLEERPVNQEGE